MPLDDNQEKREKVVQTPEQILKQAVLDTRRFDEERQAAEDSRDGEGIRNKLKERAEVVAGLPDRISEAEVLTGQKLPEDKMETLRSLQNIARKALERGNVYELGMVLTDTQRTPNTGELNLLEQLVNRLYPQKP
jgi:hypothetical protein